jgi:hypothetical protein
VDEHERRPVARFGDVEARAAGQCDAAVLDRGAGDGPHPLAA